jgi:hypothetical protein
MARSRCPFIARVRTRARSGRPRSHRRRVRHRDSAECWRPSGSRAARPRTGNSRPDCPCAAAPRPWLLPGSAARRRPRRPGRRSPASPADPRYRVASAPDSALPPADRVRSVCAVAMADMPLAVNAGRRAVGVFMAAKLPLRRTTPTPVAPSLR